MAALFGIINNFWNLLATCWPPAGQGNTCHVLSCCVCICERLCAFACLCDFGCMCVCVCVCVDIFVCVHVCVCVSLCARVCNLVVGRIVIFTCAFVFPMTPILHGVRGTVSELVGACVRACVGLCVCVCVCVCVCICV